MSAPRPCRACGRPLVQRPGERPAALRRRHTCDRDCDNTYRAQKAAARKAELEAGRKCESCGAQLHIRRKEHWLAFKERKYCSTDCRVAELPGARAAARRAPSQKARKAWRHEFDVGPLTKPKVVIGEIGERHEPIRMRELGDPCPKHPTYKLNVWGQCAACVTGARWAARQRETTARPSAEGGR